MSRSAVEIKRSVLQKMLGMLWFFFLNFYDIHEFRVIGIRKWISLTNTFNVCKETVNELLMANINTL